MSDPLAQFCNAFFSETASGGFEAAYREVVAAHEVCHV